MSAALRFAVSLLRLLANRVVVVVVVVAGAAPSFFADLFCCLWLIRSETRSGWAAGRGFISCGSGDIPCVCCGRAFAFSTDGFGGKASGWRENARKKNETLQVRDKSGTCAAATHRGHTNTKVLEWIHTNGRNWAADHEESGTIRKDGRESEGPITGGKGFPSFHNQLQVST